MKPSIGRVVHFFPGSGDMPLAALVTAVWSDTCINVAAFAGNGNPISNPPTSVTLWDGTGIRPNHPHWQWPPRVA